MDRDIERFIREYLNEVREDNAAVFAGAGMSVAAGFVDWRNLLRPIANDLQLDLAREHDLVTVAQYHVNENRGNRNRLNQLLIDQFTAGASPTENHRLLARLPIGTYWTTNYDRLLEQSLSDAGKIVDVKYTIHHLATTRARRDVILYKMHGDVEHPNDAVLTKDDYERYHLTHGAFINALGGDLVSKTFLFLGFSFSDPNLDYVLSRIRVVFKENQRRHYCVFKTRRQEPHESLAAFQHAEIKQRLAIEDLKRFNITTLLIDDYSQITEILRSLERQYRQRTVFISGSAAEFSGWEKAEVDEFIRDLSRALIQRGYRIATGVGAGIGDAVVTGSIEEVHRAGTGHLEDYLIMRPFPRLYSDEDERQRAWEKYRQDTVSEAGICLLLLGNKLQDGSIVNAEGVRREFEIAVLNGLTPVPVGATGYMARVLWDEVRASFDTYFPGGEELREAFDSLGDPVQRPVELISRILDFLTLIAKE